MNLRTALAILGIGMMAANGAKGEGVGVTAKAGTLGLGGDLTVGLASRLNVRAGYNGFSYTHDFKIEDSDVTGELDWGTIPILLDWHAFGGGFRVSAGGVVNNNEIRISADPTERLVVNGIPFRIESLDGRMTFDDFGGYFGIGYGNAVSQDGRWHFACDFGVLYQGEPQVTARAVAQDPRVQSVLDKELAMEVAEFQDDAKEFVWYPVVSLGVSFAF